MHATHTHHTLDSTWPVPAHLSVHVHCQRANERPPAAGTQQEVGDVFRQVQLLPNPLYDSLCARQVGGAPAAAAATADSISGAGGHHYVVTREGFDCDGGRRRGLV